MFSTGVVLFAISTGRYPFEWAHASDKKYRLFIEKNYEPFWKHFEKILDFSDSFKDLIQKMLAYDPLERITLQEIAAHDWFLEVPA